MHAAMPDIGFKFLAKTLELACNSAVKQDPNPRLYRTSNIEGRKRFYVYFTREALALSSSLAEEVEKPKKAATHDDIDATKSESDPFSFDIPEKYKSGRFMVRLCSCKCS
jgi:hypothetical protein